VTGQTMRILVCMKAVLDPEASPQTLRVGADGVSVAASGTPRVLNPYDANALAAALDLRSISGADITVLTADPKPARSAYLKALAAGADRVVAVRTPDVASRASDAWRTAGHLAAGAEDAGYDLVLCGRQASDTTAGLVGAFLAEMLGLAMVTLAIGLHVGDDGRSVVVTRLTERGTEIVAVPTPALVTVSSEIGDLPYPTLPAMRAAQGKPFDVVEPSVEPAGTPAVPSTEVLGVARPPSERDCLMLSDGAALAEELVARTLLGS